MFVTKCISCYGPLSLIVLGFGPEPPLFIMDNDLAKNIIWFVAFCCYFGVYFVFFWYYLLL